MSSLFAWWWLALPMLALPLWWHRQRRQQDTAKTLATARFLPKSDPRLQSVWRWRQYLLLVLRLWMLLCLLALIAGIFYHGRGDTIFVSRQANKSWVKQQIDDANKQTKLPWSKAQVVEFCGDATCAIASDDILRWLAAHQVEWKPGSRWLVLADANASKMSSAEPQYQQSLDLRVDPSPERQALVPPQTILVLVKSARIVEWKAWFKVFEESLNGKLHFDLREQLEKTPKQTANLVIWESPLAPAAELQAPLWWVSEGSAFKDRRGTTKKDNVVQELDLKVFETTQGKVWLRSEKSDWPLYDLSRAKRLFEIWRSVQTQRDGFPIQALHLEAKAQVNVRSADLLQEQKPNLDTYWIWALLALFCVERMVNHARRS